MAKCEYPIWDNEPGRKPRPCGARKKWEIIFQNKKIVVCGIHRQANGK